MRRLTPILTGTGEPLTAILMPWQNTLRSEGPEETINDYGDRYSFGLALSIRDLLADVRCLYEAERIRGIRLIVRPLLENAFNLACSFNIPDFPRTKSASEFKDYIKRVRTWKSESKDRSGDAELDSMIQNMEGNFADLTNKFGPVEDKKWAAYEVAMKSSLSNQYRSAFFGYSTFTHVHHISLFTEGKPEEADSSAMVIVLISLQAIGIILDGKPALDSEAIRDRLIELSLESQRIKQAWNYS